MKLFVFLACLAVASAGVVPSESARAVPVKDMPRAGKIEGRITNGYPAYEGKIPYIVGLSFTTPGANHVLIYFGASFRHEAQYTHWVSRSDMIQHPDWNDFLNNDIALIRIPHVDFWNLVNKVELPSYNDRYNSFSGWWAVASGWGLTDNNSGMSNYLNSVDVQIMDNNDCRNYYGGNYVIDNTICINTDGGKSSCSGDSGGPLVLHDTNRIVGIVSFGSGEGCTAGRPAGFTRVTGYLDWIRDHTGIVYQEL
ncbi:GM21056 [Drosophila sechellia]|uniref:GM21056 n=1 Tax=Drosophila sechellia TaxID=7238 RepID=B4HS77_DROSE|nr:GM21056 [Drosophila sechellia]